MNNFGPWFSASFNELKLRWQAHLIPALVLMGVVFGLTMAVFLVMGVVIALSSLVSEDLMLVVAGIGYVVLLGGLTIGMGPLLVGYYRHALKVMRGEPASLKDLFATDAIFSAMATNFLVAGACLIAAMFCYLPLFPVSALLLFAIPVLADNPGMGPIDAIKRSIELARPVVWELMLYWFLAAMLATFCGYIPIIGMLIVLPAMTTFILTPYLHLNDGVLAGRPFIDEDERGAIDHVPSDPNNPYRAPSRI